MRALVLLLALAPFAAEAQVQAPMIRDVVEDHILPGFAALDTSAAGLAAAAQADCAPEAAPLRAAYGAAFDAWVSVSHLRFGPTETGDRAFALAFWPDPRGATPEALRKLILDADPASFRAETFSGASIAARGFYAMEFLLYDPAFADPGRAEDRCALIRAVATDIAANATAIDADWRGGYGDLLMTAGANDRYRNPAEATQELYKALTSGLEFLSDTRIGRPLGTFDAPRPTRAEARRSGRSQRQVVLSLAALHDLAARLAPAEAAFTPRLIAAFDRAERQAAALDDPAFAGIADPQGWLKLEVLQQSVEAIREIVAADLGPALGVAAGFNAQDGD